jgi:hypothetical protein
VQPAQGQRIPLVCSERSLWSSADTTGLSKAGAAGGSSTTCAAAAAAGGGGCSSGGASPHHRAASAGSQPGGGYGCREVTPPHPIPPLASPPFSATAVHPVGVPAIPPLASPPFSAPQGRGVQVAPGRSGGSHTPRGARRAHTPPSHTPPMHPGLGPGEAPLSVGHSLSAGRVERQLAHGLGQPQQAGQPPPLPMLNVQVGCESPFSLGMPAVASGGAGGGAAAAGGMGAGGGLGALHARLGLGLQGRDFAGAQSASPQMPMVASPMAPQAMPSPMFRSQPRGFPALSGGRSRKPAAVWRVPAAGHAAAPAGSSHSPKPNLHPGPAGSP